MSDIMPGQPGDTNTTAIDRLRIMIRTDQGNMSVWTADEVRVALDAYRAEVERQTRGQVEDDFHRLGKTQNMLSWGEAVAIAREGLCSCRGGIKPCTEAGAR